MAALFHLPERCLIKVSGDDAEVFLQNLVTQDVAGLAPERLVYGCLLTPQGRFLHDFFIFKQSADFFLEVETERREDLIRRLKIFKLRSKVVIEDCSAAFAVYAGDQGRFRDPRLTELGYRSYQILSSRQSAERDEGSDVLQQGRSLTSFGMTETETAAAYKDHRIHLGVPEGSIDIKPEGDTLSDANLDLLQGVSWTKGCFVGQEVAARMENRGLVKKRMVIATGIGLAAGSALSQNGVAVGELRSVNSTGTEGLAILKLAALDKDLGPIMQAGSTIIAAHLPLWLSPENT